MMASARSALFGLVTLLPLAVSPALASPRGGLSLALCSADGVTRSIEVPTGPAAPPGEDGDRLCAKACHGGGSRKKTPAIS